MKKMLILLLFVMGCAAEETDSMSQAVTDDVAAADAGSADLMPVCTRRTDIPCGVILGRVVYCNPCVCWELPGCHGNPMCAGCADGFKQAPSP
jgi:hypothetical protein